MRGIGVLQVEPTDCCNYIVKCASLIIKMAFCSRDPKGFFYLDVFEQLVNNLLEEQVEFDHIIFQWLGDPLVHPKIDSILNMAQILKHQVDIFALIPMELLGY